MGAQQKPKCEYVVTWGNDRTPTQFCGTLATRRYPAMGGGYMHLCDEHSIPHRNYTEPVPAEWMQPKVAP